MDRKMTKHPGNMPVKGHGGSRKSHKPVAGNRSGHGAGARTGTSGTDDMKSKRRGSY